MAPHRGENTEILGLQPSTGAEYHRALGNILTRSANILPGDNRSREMQKIPVHVAIFLYGDRVRTGRNGRAGEDASGVTR